MGLLHVICDYGAGDLAFSEVASALARHIPDDCRIHLTAVGSFETLATGFVLGQLSQQGEDARPIRTFFFVNCAPRQDRSEARKNNEGEGLLYGKLKNGVPMLVVNGGHSLSFVRDELAELWSTTVAAGGSQFRSRDIFPPFAGRMIRDDLEFLKEKIDPLKIVPAIPEGVIGYIDSFGNLKTTHREGDPLLAELKPGQRLPVRINGFQVTVTVGTGTFNVHEGDFAFAPGSSGHGRRFWEIFQRGGSAWHTFHKPRVGSLVQLG